jgi:hypothetical protein
MSSKHVHNLNNMAPAAKRANLGTLLETTIAAFNSLRTRLSCVMLTSAGLAIVTGSSPTARAVNAFVAIVDGTYVRKAAATAMSALVGTLPTANSALWAFYIDAAGTITTSAKSANAATHAAALALLPAVPANQTMIGFIIVDNATGSNFVGGTTALDAASVTTTYYSTVGALNVADIAAIPTLESL